MSSNHTSKLLASASSSIKMWSRDDENGTMIAEGGVNAHGYDGNINAVRWNSNCKVLASGGSDGCIALTHKTGSSVGVLSTKDVNVYKSNNPVEVLAIGLSSGSRFLTSGDNHGVVLVWDLKRKTPIKSFTSHEDQVTAVSFNPDDTHLATGDGSGNVHLHSLVNGKTTCELRREETQCIRSLQYSPFRKSILATGSDDGGVNLWDVNKQRVIHSFQEHHSTPAMGVNFSPINNLLLCSVGFDRRINFYDSVNPKVVKSMSLEAPGTALSFLNDGITVAVGTSKGFIHLYDLRAESSPFASVEAHAGTPVFDLQFQHTYQSVSWAKSTSQSQSSSSSLSSNAISDKQLMSDKDKMIMGSPSMNKTKGTKKSQGQQGQAKQVQQSQQFTPPNRTTTQKATEMGIFSPVNNNLEFTRDESNSADISNASSVFNPQQSLMTEPVQEDTLQISTNAGYGYGKSRPTFQQQVQQQQIQQQQAQPRVEQHLEPMQPNPQNSSSTSPYGHKLAATNISDIVSPIQAEKVEQQSQQPQSQPQEREIQREQQQQQQQQQQQTYQAESGQGVQGTMAMSEFQTAVVKNLIDEQLSKFKDGIHFELQNIHLELIRQFHIQQSEIASMLEQYHQANLSLQKEVEELKEENAMLRSRNSTPF